MIDPPPHREPPASTPVLKTALRYDALLAVAIAVIAGILGWVFAGGPGLAGALVGTAMAVLFLAITAGSILVANRFAGSDLFVGAFFGIVLGSWLVKFIVFIVLALVLKDQPWLDRTVLFLSIIASVVGSLAIDLAVALRSRMLYVSDANLPGSGDDSQ